MTDERFEAWIAVLLRAGVLAAAAIVLAGGVGHLAAYSHTMPSYRVFHGEPPQYTHPKAIAAAAFRLDWLAVIQFGLLVLIATPVARVALSIVAFALERDWTYVTITAIVLAILLYSLLS
jgi:uncharacterized membrane protein